MLVYSTEIFLEPTPDVLEKLRGAIQEWLLRKIGPEFAGTQIIPFGDRRFQNHEGSVHKVKIIGTPTDTIPNYCSIQYSHPDKEVRGRTWVSSIGFEQLNSNNPVKCTILLETSEISAIAGAAPVNTSIPGIVRNITKRCSLHATSLSLGILKVTHDKTGEFLDLLKSDQRTFPIILVSVDENTREPLVDLEILRNNLLGIAQIALIPNDFEAKLIAGKIPKRYSAWNGSINIIRPSYKGFPRSSYYQRDAIVGSGDFNKFILDTIVHYQNFPISRRHISESSVTKILNAFNIRRLKIELQEKKGDFSQFEELVSSYDEDNRRSKEEITELKEEVFAKELYSEDLEQQIDQLKSKISALQYRLSQAGNEDNSVESPIAAEEIPESFLEIITRLEDNVNHTVVLTGKAERSLKKCGFNDVGRVWKTIQILNEDLSRTFCEGYDLKLVTERLKSETNSTYVSNTSEKTLGQCDGYDVVHDGRTIIGRKHVKLGCSRDPQRCFRLYFDWDQPSGKIVVTHAGAHLDNQMT